MRKLTPVLNSKGLLAASIAMLSGHAVAEVAGRVTFVSGDASVTAADGSSRAIKRGDSINGGDRIKTNAGRVQIRFTDGGFVSLQPGTAFGVDEYVYANRKPEETSLFFSLLQGGMRTISGAIGKVNKKSYQVRTPVATIGIRGTEYRARVDNDGLIVSVGSGFVNVATRRGDITGGAGQNIHVGSPDELPRLGVEQAEVLATGVNGDGGQEQEPGDDKQDPSLAIGDIQNGRGDYIFLFTSVASLSNSDPMTGSPKYRVDSPFLDPAFRASSFLADFDQDGATTGQQGGLLDLYYYGSNPPLYTFASEGLKVVNAGGINNLAWGEFTNGSTATNSLFDSCGALCYSGFTYNASQFMPYIVGTPAISNLGRGTVTYSYAGGTPVRDAFTGVAGVVDKFRLTVNLDRSTLDAALQVSIPVSTGIGAAAVTAPTTTTKLTYTVKTPTPVSILNLANQGRFTLDSSKLSVTDSNGGCAISSGSCTAGINGFFSGDMSGQAGTSYFIKDYWNYHSLSGVAALSISDNSGSTVLEPGAGYTAAYAGTFTGANVAGGYTGYDQADPVNPVYWDTSLNATFDTSGGFSSATVAGNPSFDRGTAAIDNVGKKDSLTWGRWYSTDTTGVPVTVNGSQTSVNTQSSVHYVMGQMTQPDAINFIRNFFGWGAKATYTFQGGTKATGSTGDIGKVRSGSNLVVTFYGSPQLKLDMNVDMDSGTNYHITGITSAAVSTSSGARFSFYSGSGSTCSGGAAGSSSGCSATVQGFFAGAQAQQVGLGYHIYDYNGSTVDGAAAFGRGSITRGTAQPPL